MSVIAKVRTPSASLLKSLLRYQPLALRPADAAAMFGVSLGTLRNWIAEGRIRGPYTVGPRLQLFDTEELREDWEKLKSDHASEAAANPWDEIVESV